MFWIRPFRNQRAFSRSSYP